MSTPKPNASKKANSSQKSSQGQRSILGFFNKKSADQLGSATPNGSTATPALKKNASSHSTASLTPAPSSDPVAPSSPVQSSQDTLEALVKDKENGLPSPITPVELEADRAPGKAGVSIAFSSPSRKVSAYEATEKGWRLTLCLGEEVC